MLYLRNTTEGRKDGEKLRDIDKKSLRKKERRRIRGKWRENGDIKGDINKYSKGE